MLIPSVPRSMLIATALGLFLGAAQAASGFNVTRDQEALVRTGMTTDEVRQVLGPPQVHVKYRNEPGPTFTYRVLGAVAPTLFDVDFGADGLVLSMNERLDLSGGGPSHRGRR